LLKRFSKTHTHTHTVSLSLSFSLSREGFSGFVYLENVWKLAQIFRRSPFLQINFSDVIKPIDSLRISVHELKRLALRLCRLIRLIFQVVFYDHVTWILPWRKDFSIPTWMFDTKLLKNRQTQEVWSKKSETLHEEKHKWLITSWIVAFTGRGEVFNSELVDGKQVTYWILYWILYEFLIRLDLEGQEYIFCHFLVEIHLACGRRLSCRSYMIRKPTGSGFRYLSDQIWSLSSWVLHRPVLRMAMERFKSNFAEPS
jgi:hypothetical protein